MSSVRLSRVSENVREALAEIMEFELKDPRIELVTVTSVDISPDLKHAKIYLSILGDEDKKAETLSVLNSARGFFRAQLGKKIRLKSIPELQFFEDKSIEEGRKIDELIKEMTSGRGEKPEESS